MAIADAAAQIKFLQQPLGHVEADAGVFRRLAGGVVVGGADGAVGAQRDLRLCKRRVEEAQAKNRIQGIATAAGENLAVFQTAVEVQADLVRDAPLDAALQLFKKLARAVVRVHIANPGTDAQRGALAGLIVQPVERAPSAGGLRAAETVRADRGDVVDDLAQGQIEGIFFAQLARGGQAGVVIFLLGLGARFHGERIGFGKALRHAEKPVLVAEAAAQRRGMIHGIMKRLVRINADGGRVVQRPVPAKVHADARRNGLDGGVHRVARAGFEAGAKGDLIIDVRTDHHLAEF